MLAVANRIPNAIILNLKYQTRGVPTARIAVASINVPAVTKVVRSNAKSRFKRSGCYESPAIEDHPPVRQFKFLVSGLVLIPEINPPDRKAKG